MKRTKLISIEHVNSEKELDILKQIGLEQYEIEFIMYLRYKEDLGNKWKKY